MTGEQAALAAPAGLLAPASYAQERVWLASQVAHDVPVYHVADTLSIHTCLEAGPVRAALLRIVERHAALRTCFRLVDGVLNQVVSAAVADPTRILDLRGVDGTAQSEHCSRLRRELVFEPFDLTRAPLWRAALVRLRDDEWLVLFAAHHCVYDAASAFNLRAEMTELCAAAEQGRAADLPELPVHYPEYAVRQRERLSGPAMTGLRDFWAERLAGLPAVRGLPTDRPRPHRRTFAGAEVREPLPPSVAEALPRTARELGATPATVSLAAYAALIAGRTGRGDVVVGVPVAGRDAPELLPLIGTFVNMVVLRVDASGEPAFAELVSRVRGTLLAARRHQEMPYQLLVEAFAGRRRPGVPPLYQLGFNVLEGEGPAAVSGTAEDDLLLEVGPRSVRVEYNTALFDAGTAQDIAADYIRVLEAGLTDPGAVAGRPAGGAARTGSGPGARARAEDSGTPPPTVDHVAPRTAAEQLAASVWAELLGVRRVGAFDDFFGLGGHSLLALRALSRLAAESGTDVPIAAFFADPTVAGVAAWIERPPAAADREFEEADAP